MRDFKHFEHAKFVDMLNNMPFESVFKCTLVNEALELWHSMVKEAVDVCAPIKSKTPEIKPLSMDFRRCYTVNEHTRLLS